MFVRVEVAVRPDLPDPEANHFLRRLELAYPELKRKVRWCRLLQVYWLDLDAPRELVRTAIAEIFQDKVLNWLFTGDLLPSAAGSHGTLQDLVDHAPFRWGRFWGIEKRFRHGVTDNVGRSAMEALQMVLGSTLKSCRVASGQVVLLESGDLVEEDISHIARNIFCNDLIESWNTVVHDELKSSSRFHPEQVKWDLPRTTPKTDTKKMETQVETFPLEGLSDVQLLKLSHDHLWALNLAEMKAIRDYFYSSRAQEQRKAKGLKHPTDVELEIIAQTWSEHCKHKIFNAKIRYQEEVSSDSSLSYIERGRIPAEIHRLFKETIVKVTDSISRPWLLSVFKDNAGIIAFDETDALCIKVETHNSPSALDPYGGALTGILGVNRDIMGCGRGAKPIFNTDVFCLAPPSYNSTLPERLLHPRRILDGVRLGVEHGGNKSGIPTVNGALYFDDRYLGKPLIFCGTGGIMPRTVAEESTAEKNIHVNDRVFMVGGRIGKDGIHGATFSSLALDEYSPQSAVQLGDAMTQRRVLDFLLEARNLGLYRTLTDNGAGGLSSSVGECALFTQGATIDVSKAKTKYPGLKPFELVVSESQERMTVAVAPEHVKAFSDLAARRSVEVCDLGHFHSEGGFEILYEGKTVGIINLEFLHQGVPQLEIEAKWVENKSTRTSKLAMKEVSFEKEGPQRLLELLSCPNVSSKEWLVRQYDHEVQGTSVVKPLHKVNVGSQQSLSGPNDGAVLKPKADSWAGVAISCGLQPRLSDWDAYLMAQASVDEAVRNALCVGIAFGRPEIPIALTDNFCWPDPLENSDFAAALVRACYGLHDAAVALEIPLVSGKDSMKNDYKGHRDGKPLQISVPPTLLMTLVGKVKDVRLARTADFKAPGDLIFILGSLNKSIIASELHYLVMDQLKKRGGNPEQAILPTSKSSLAYLKLPEPQWPLARKTYEWLGTGVGEKQILLKSAHDISDGGLLVSVCESFMASRLGARITVPATLQGTEIDPWNFCFGEGFHSFVVSVSPNDWPQVEVEWKEFGVPYLKVGEVLAEHDLRVEVETTGGQPSKWALRGEQVINAWRNDGYWE